MTYPFFVPGVRFLAPDVYAYSIAPPRFACWFPFLSSGWNTLRLSVPGWLPVAFSPDHHSPEPTVGLLTAAPFTVLALVALAAGLGRARLHRLAGDAPRWAMTRMNWLWAALLLYVAGAAPLLILNVTTMRYEQDFASGVLLLAIFGGGGCWPPRRARAAAARWRGPTGCSRRRQSSRACCWASAGTSGTSSNTTRRCCAAW